MRKLFLILFIFISTLLTANEKIKVTYDPDYAPFSYNIDGKPYGLLIDIWKEWGKQSGNEITFINGDTWDNALELVKSKKVDYFLGTDPYDDWMEASIPFYKTKTGVFTLKGNKNVKTIGIIGSDYKEVLEEELKDARVVSFESYEKLIGALISKKVDGVYDDSIAINDYIFQKRLNHLIKQTDIFSAISDICAISYDVKKIEIFNKWFHKLTKESLQDIETTWIINESERFYSKIGVDLLTKTEKRWMEQNPIARVAVMDYWPSDEYKNSLHTEVLKLINKYIGTNIVPVVFSSWQEGFSKASKGDELHGIMGLSYSKEREQKYFHYSPAYNFTPSYLITRQSEDSIKGIKDLNGKKVYLKTKSILHKMMDKKAPSAKIIDLDTVEMMYEKMISTDEADAIVTYFIDEKMIKKYDLKIVKVLYDRYGEVSVGINHKYPELSSILNKAFKLIPKTELAKVRDKKYSAVEKKIEFTKEEKKWLERKQMILYTFDPDWKPLEYKDDLDNHSGVISDLLNLIEERSGLIFKSIKSNTWAESLELMNNSTVQMLSGIGESKSLKEKYNFSLNPLLNTPYVFVSRKGEDFKNGFSDLTGKKLAVFKESTLDRILKERMPGFNYKVFTSDEKALLDLMEKRYDIVMMNAISAKYYIDVLGYNELKIAYKSELNLDLKIVLSKELPKEVLSIIDKSIASISKKEKKEILKKWTKKSKFLFTAMEKKYLDKKRTINICTNPTWAPIEFNQNGIPLGISVDILNTLKEKLNLTYNYIETSSWNESQEFLKDRKCDILPSAVSTQKRLDYANFTQPYLKYDLAIITKDDAQTVKSLESILDKKMARKQGSGLISKLKKQYPDININETKDTKGAFEAVLEGEADFTVSTLPVFLYHKSKYGFKGLKVNAYTPMKFNLSMAVRKDDLMLLEILNKSLESVPLSTHKLVHDKWASVKVVSKTNWTLIFQITGAIVLILIVVILNNRKLKNMVDDKTAELSLLLTSFDKNVIASKTDIDGNITYVSEAFCEITGYEPKDLMGKKHNIIRHPDMKDEFFKELWKTIKSGEVWKGEIKNRKKFGGYYWVEAVISPDYDKKGNLIGYSAIRQDITSKKKVEELTENLEKKVKERTLDLENAKKEVEAIHKHTRESIEYAALIQCSLIPERELFDRFFKDSFVIWHPKDTVGGDIYLFEMLRDEDECLLFVIDCTGHGVPGAFVTMLVKAIERQVIAEIIKEPDMDVSPAWIMGYFNKTMKNLLKQNHADSISNAGWDGGIIYYNKKHKVLKFAGAETSLFYIDNDGEYKTIKGNRYSVGYKKCDPDYKYKESVLEVEEGMQFYCTTDGYLDQNGGEKDFPFGKKRFRDILCEYSDESMADQQTVLLYKMLEYEKMVPDNDRNDDMTVIGFKI